MQDAITAAREPAQLQSQEDVVRVRQQVRNLAIEIGLSLVEQTKLVTAASELARNTVIHGGGGYAEMQVLRTPARMGIRLAFVDHGPGIPDLRLALSDGYSTKDSLGLGLSGSKRLADEFDIESEPGQGTRVIITKWKR